VIALCAREPDKLEVVRAALRLRSAWGCSFHAPHCLVMEALYVLCNKAQQAALTEADYAKTIRALGRASSRILFPPDGDASLILDAERIREGYGCSRSADSLYIALAERLAASGPAELLTFDVGQVSHAATAAPTVKVALLETAPVAGDGPD